MKKFFNIILIILGVALIGVCVDLTTNKLAKTDYNSLDAVDREAIAELCGMTELFKDRRGCSDVWSENYNLRDYKAVVTRKLGIIKGTTYAVNLNVSKNIFAQQIIMPDEYSDIAVYRFAYFTPFTFSLYNNKSDTFSYVNGERVYIDVYDSQSIRAKGTGSMEEVYVKETFFDAVESLDVPSRINASFEIKEENVALIGLEYRILDDMLVEDNDEKLHELVKEYVAVREYQNSKNLLFAKYRNQMEAREGCAQYAFYNISDLIDHDITYFNKEKDDSITFYSAYYYLCTGRYNSDINDYFNETGIAYEGAALCRVIEDNHLYTNWCNRVDANENDIVAPYTLLKRRCERNYGGYRDVSLDDIKRSYNYEEIISMARTLVNGVS